MTSTVIYPARNIHSMGPETTRAEAFSVRAGLFTGLGTVEDLKAQSLAQFPNETVSIDDRLADKVVLPGLIDNHLHPFLGAIILPSAIIAPEPWKDVDGKICPAVRDASGYQAALLRCATQQADNWLISWGYYPNLHGHLSRKELNRLVPDRPVMLWHRSFHEAVFNDKAIEQLAIEASRWEQHPQMNLENGHCWETGMQVVLAPLLPLLMRPQWYRRGLQALAKQMHQGGITTAADMAFGLIAPAFERQELEQVVNEAASARTRIVNIFDLRSFANRASGKPQGPPDAAIDFSAGLRDLRGEFGLRSGKLWNSRAVKLFADGAMFSQLMQMRPPGYNDGHLGQWLMSPEQLRLGLKAAWAEGLSVHIHVNGDAGLDAVIEAVKTNHIRPSDTQRLLVHHLGYHAPDQTRSLRELGIHASVNPYYVHALADEYSVLGLGAERAERMVSAGSLLKAGIRVSLHSDFSMAPCEPLSLAWCAANRRTVSGKVVGEAERLSLDQALRAITLDAAWALGLENELGSIEPGKIADWCVLDQDPDELGVEGLNKLNIRGSALEGNLSLFEQGQDSILSDVLEHIVPVKKARGSVDGYRRLRAARSAQGDCGERAEACDFLPLLARVCSMFDFSKHAKNMPLQMKSGLNE